MLSLILVAASFLPATEVSVKCARTSKVETEMVRGPIGTRAVLKVATHDDYSKDAHLCEADDQLVITEGPHGKTKVVDILSSDDEYNRDVSLRLSGFSKDGKRVFGILSETGVHASTTVFDYDVDGGGVQLVDVTRLFAASMSAECSSRFAVLGTTASGAIVLELDSPSQCKSNGRWEVAPLRRRAKAPSRERAFFGSLRK